MEIYCKYDRYAVNELILMNILYETRYHKVHN